MGEYPKPTGWDSRQSGRLVMCVKPWLEQEGLMDGTRQELFCSPHSQAVPNWSVQELYLPGLRLYAGPPSPATWQSWPLKLVKMTNSAVHTLTIPTHTVTHIHLHMLTHTHTQSP